MQIEKIRTNKSPITFVLPVSLSYLVNFTACFFYKKHFSPTQVMNLKLKQFKCERHASKLFTKRIHTDVFISWHRISNGAT